LCFVLSLDDTFDTVVVELDFEVDDCGLGIDWKDVLNVEDVATEILIMLRQLQKGHTVSQLNVIRKRF
jgi:hypothetical protein